MNQPITCSIYHLCSIIEEKTYLGLQSSKKKEKLWKPYKPEESRTKISQFSIWLIFCLISCLLDQLSPWSIVYLISCLLDQLSIWSIVSLANYLPHWIPTYKTKWINTKVPSNLEQYCVALIICLYRVYSVYRTKLTGLHLFTNIILALRWNYKTQTK